MATRRHKNAQKEGRKYTMAKNICPKCGMKFDTKKIGLHQLMKHWAKMQNQGDEAHS